MSDESIIAVIAFGTYMFAACLAGIALVVSRLSDVAGVDEDERHDQDQQHREADGDALLR